LTRARGRRALLTDVQGDRPAHCARLAHRAFGARLADLVAPRPPAGARGPARGNVRHSISTRRRAACPAGTIRLPGARVNVVPGQRAHRCAGAGIATAAPHAANVWRHAHAGHPAGDRARTGRRTAAECNAAAAPAAAAPAARGSSAASAAASTAAAARRRARGAERVASTGAAAPIVVRLWRGPAGTHAVLIGGAKHDPPAAPLLLPEPPELPPASARSGGFTVVPPHAIARATPSETKNKLCWTFMS
jgi:hypothetical protein